LTGAGNASTQKKILSIFKMAATLTGGAIGAMTSSGDGVASLVGALGGSKGSSCKGGTTIPFMIEGTASEPKFVPDVGGRCGEHAEVPIRLRPVARWPMSAKPEQKLLPVDAVKAAQRPLSAKRKIRSAKFFSRLA